MSRDKKKYNKLNREQTKILQTKSAQNPSPINKLKIQGSFNSNFNIKLSLSSHKDRSYGILWHPNYKNIEDMTVALLEKVFYSLNQFTYELLLQSGDP